MPKNASVFIQIFFPQPPADRTKMLITTQIETNQRKPVRSCGLLISRLVVFQTVFVSATTADTPGSEQAANQLEDLISENRTYQTSYSPMLAVLAHERMGADSRQDVSKEGPAAWQKHDEQVLRDRRSIPRRKPTLHEQSAYDRFENEARSQAEELQHPLNDASLLSHAIRLWPTVPQAMRFDEQRLRLFATTKLAAMPRLSFCLRQSIRHRAQRNLQLSLRFFVLIVV